MTIDVREKAHKLQDKLCARTVEYKGIKESACETCESPCRYGGDLLALLGKPKPQTPAGVYREAVPGQAPSMRRVIRSVNKRWR